MLMYCRVVDMYKKFNNSYSFYCLLVQGNSSLFSAIINNDSKQHKNKNNIFAKIEILHLLKVSV